MVNLLILQNVLILMDTYQMKLTGKGLSKEETELSMWLLEVLLEEKA